MSFPSNEAHLGLPIDQEAVNGQNVHPQVAQEMVTSWITDTAEVRQSLGGTIYVDNVLCKEIGQKQH